MTETKMRVCAGCGVEFIPPPACKNYRCVSCHRDYCRAWRIRRRAEGLPASGSDVWDKAKREAWMANYKARPEVRIRKAAQMRISASKYPERVSARRMVRTAVAAGRLTRKPCEVCGEAKTHGHHDDYAKPLDVRWLCHLHHVEHHTKAEGK